MTEHEPPQAPDAVARAEGSSADRPRVLESKDCPHDLAERETAVADGMCPQCLAAQLTRVTAERDDLERKWEPAKHSLGAAWKERAEAAEAALSAHREEVKAIAQDREPVDGRGGEGVGQ